MLIALFWIVLEISSKVSKDTTKSYFSCSSLGLTIACQILKDLTFFQK